MARRRGIKKTDNLKNRTKQITLRLSPEEEDILYDAAEANEASVQNWARTRLLAAADVEQHDSTYSRFWKEHIEKLEADDEDKEGSVDRIGNE